MRFELSDSNGMVSYFRKFSDLVAAVGSSGLAVSIPIRLAGPFPLPVRVKNVNNVINNSDICLLTY